MDTVVLENAPGRPASRSVMRTHTISKVVRRSVWDRPKPGDHQSPRRAMFDLVALAKSGLSIHSAVSGGAFGAALAAMAVVEMEAARASFSAVSGSAQPREALNRTLTHLESAHVALRKSWSSFTVSMRPFMRARQANWDSRVCCLIAYLHRVLGDANHLILRALQAAEEARMPGKNQFRTAEEKVGAAFLVPFLVDASVALFTVATGGSCPPIPDDEFAGFLGLLGFSIQTAQPEAEPGAASSWKAGAPHPTQPNVFAGAAPNQWCPAPGYYWVNETNDDLRVEWSPGRPHPDHPNVVAGSQEGLMIPAPGFKWLDDSSADFRVVRR